MRKISTALEWYSGVEVSTIYKGYKIHLLGYGFEEENSHLNQLLDWIQERRDLRFDDMLKKAEEYFQMEISKEYFDELKKQGVILGKPHLVQYLLECGYSESSADIFEMIDQHCVSKIGYRADLKWAIARLKEAKGILMLAHPGEIEREHHIAIESILKDLLDLGIDGIEVYHSSHTDSEIKRFHTLVKQYHILESGGSDYHGSYRNDRELGYVTKSKQKIKTLSLLEELRRRK